VVIVEVCRVDELAPGAVRRVTEGVPEPVALFNVDGELFAIDDTCTHQDAALSDGWIEGCTVECPLHSSCFDLRSGAPIGPPAKVAVRTHVVRVVDGVVTIEVSERSSQAASA